MPKKAKRRGRPPGSKNKKSTRSPRTTKPFRKLEVGELRRLIDGLELLLSQRIQHQKAVLQGHLSELQGYVPRHGAGPKVKGRRAKAKPKYQSKKKPSLKWSGRGMVPVWMREEMKGTKLKKDDFLIA